MDSELALIQTLDFFPPVVDDPYTYGQIAAANAMSERVLPNAAAASAST